MAYMMMVNPRTLQPMLTTPLGWLMLGGAAVLMCSWCVLDESSREGGRVMTATTMLIVGIVGIFAALFLSLAAIGVFTN